MNVEVTLPNNNSKSRSDNSTWLLLLSEEVFRRALEHIAFEDKIDFLLALERVPFLVEFESNPANFLQREDYNIERAVKRVCMYWKYRCEVFGSERAFCPMTLTGDGALSPEDVAGYCAGMVFPMNEGTGSAPTLYMDTMLNYAQPSGIRRKIHFYAMQFLSEYDASVKPGFTFVAFFYNMMSVDTTSRINAKVTRDGLPVQLASGHIFCVPNGQSSSFAEFIVRCFAALSTVFSRILNIHTLIHADSSPVQRLQKLLALGIPANKVPTTLGGTFTREDFLAWVAQRQELERQRYLNFWFDSSVPGLIQQGNSVQHFSNQTQPQPLQAMEISQNHFDLSLRAPFPQFLPNNLAQILQSPINEARLQQNEDNFGMVEDTAVISNFAKLTLLVEQAERLPRATRPIRQDDAYIKLGINDFCTTIEETTALCQTARDAVKEILALIPFAEKSAYIEACCRCPSLTETESDVMRFLRNDNYDANAAVGRLVRYWRLRREIFGERAFLPMSRTGHGTLTREDVVILKSGVLVLLPNDSDGRSVIMENRNRILDDNSTSQHAQLRCLFYVLSLLSETSNCHEDGFVWLSAVITPRVTNIRNEFMTRSLEVLDGFPARLKAAHLLVCPPKSVKKTGIDDIVSSTVSIFESKYGQRVILHSGAKASDLAEKLSLFGLDKVSLPAVLGGSWAYERWITFLRQQHQKERDRDKSGGSSASASCDGGGAGPMSSVTGTAAVVETSRTRPLTGAERKLHSRKLNVIYSRQKRERQHAQVDRLKEQCNEIEASNRALAADNDRLELLLEHAEDVLQRHGIDL